MRTVLKVNRVSLLLAAGVLGAAAVVFLSGGMGKASQSFSPSFDVSLASSQTGKAAGVTITSQVAAGQHPIDSVSFFPPTAWYLAGDRQVPDGDQVGILTVSADIGCDGSIDDLPGRPLVDVKASDSETKSEWVTIGTGWQFRVIVSEYGGEHELTVVLANGSMPRPICAPQTFTLAINGVSNPGNATVIANPSQSGTYTWSALYVSLGLEHVYLAKDTVAVGVATTPTPTSSPTAAATATPAPSPTPSADVDGDGFPNDLEQNCGSNPASAASVPERVDGVFAGRDDDGDTLVDETLPATASGYDCDRDGFRKSAEDHVYFPSVQGDQDPCGTNSNPPTVPASPLGWPADLKGSSLSNNRVTVEDLASFVAPVRYYNSNVGTRPGDRRWDLAPGSGFMTKDINIQDISTLLSVPPMLGKRALGGPYCPWP